MVQESTATQHDRARAPVVVRLRASLLMALSTSVLLAAWALVGAPAVSILTSRTEPTFAALLEAGCGLVLVGCALWAELVTVAVGIEAVRCRRSPALETVVPAALRRFLLGCCGVALIGGLGLAPVSADVPETAAVADVPGTTANAETTETGSTKRGSEPRLTGLSLPDRPTGAGPTGHPAGATHSGHSDHGGHRGHSDGGTRLTPESNGDPGRPDARPAGHAVARAPAATPSDLAGRGQVRVRPGDTLWSLSAARLASAAKPGAANLDDRAPNPGRAPGPTPGATPGRIPEPEAAAVTRAWHALYLLNRDAIGPDPDLILPGTVLDLPDELTPIPRGEDHR